MGKQEGDNGPGKGKGKGKGKDDSAAKPKNVQSPASNGGGTVHNSQQHQQPTKEQKAAKGAAKGSKEGKGKPSHSSKGKGKDNGGKKGKGKGKY